MDFAFLVCNRVKVKESEKIDNNLDLAIEFKNLWNMKVTVISVTVDMLGTVPEI